MSNQWFRVWHGFINDPKWRAVARQSKQPISSVISVYMFLLEFASQSDERGRICRDVTEDICNSIDLEESQVSAILSSMQGRVIDGDVLTGWFKRQPIREDNSTDRVRAYREKKKNVTQCNEVKRNVTQCNDTVTQCNARYREDTDTDTDKELLELSFNKLKPNSSPVKKIDSEFFEEFWKEYPRRVEKKKALAVWKKLKLDKQHQEIMEGLKRYNKSTDWKKENGKYIPYPERFLSKEKWTDEVHEAFDFFAPHVNPFDD